MISIRALVAALATVFGLATAAQADENTVSYNLQPNTCSKPIAVPANNKPVILAGTTITYGDRAEGHVVLQRATANSQLLSWEGDDYYYGREIGFTSGTGSIIMYLDYGGGVSVQTDGPAHIKVCNVATFAEQGYLTFMY
ncbi:MAG TPA: hypothetical protein VGM17_16340 [Rhizomicrobium sp.]|jgi:hypothetical protein